MTFATLPKVSPARFVGEMTRLIAAEAHPSGCSCRTSFRCEYCATYQRVYRKLRGMLNRLDCTELHEIAEPLGCNLPSSEGCGGDPAQGLRFTQERG